MLGGAARGRFHRSVGQSLERNAAFDHLLLQDIVHCLELEFVRRVQKDGVFALHLDLRLGILQVEAGGHFLHGLLDGIRCLLQVDFAYDIESIFGHSVAT